MEAANVIRSVRDQIVNHIRDELLCGKVPAGERLSEAKLAQVFGVSRGPIRESLAQLVNEGLLISKPNCGVVVAPEPNGEICEVIVPIRRTIEVYALKTIFDSLGPKDFRIWGEILHRLEMACEDGNLELIALCDIEFHRSIVLRAGNMDIQAVWQAILVRVRGHFRNAVKHYGGSYREIYLDHRRLMDTFQSGDKELSLKALSEHIW